ncbi:MAG: decaprenyl-phosphate phosphoribosyltransferase, partial [Chloroflexi bacterium]|nr:decaprenyl-phosphate phosphoribosyltransferase [Chloroflexota bacterium]
MTARVEPAALPLEDAEMPSADRRSPGASGPLVLLEALRPRQWIKNLLLFAGLLFTFNLRRWEPVLVSIAAFACFCALSSAVYLLNDMVDRERDLSHPRKRLRPIASGRLSLAGAAAAGVALAGAGLAGSFAIRPLFGALAFGFLVLNLAYSLWLKHEVIVDVLCLAAGFIVRALAGAVALAVTISPWLLVCTALLALVMGFGKRRQEITSLDSAADHRRVLQEYSAPFLDQLITSMAAATVVSYLFYTFQSDTAHLHPWIPMTIPFVLYGLFRYLYLVHERSMGGAPEDLLFRDRRLLIAVLGWG